MTQIAAGKRLRSHVCGTEVVLVRAPDQPVLTLKTANPLPASD